MSYTPDGRSNLNRPTPEELAEARANNAAARAKFEAERAAAAAAKVAEFEARREAEFKQSTRLRYASLSDADFERLWPTIRDDELIANAKRLAETPRSSDAMYDLF